ncbi:hypothetical protein GCM10010440_56980 [Kitasatospora cinereorecta]
MPSGREYGVGGGTEAAIVRVSDGHVLWKADVNSSCTGLAAGPAGELAVATLNGVILFDPTQAVRDTA